MGLFRNAGHRAGARMAVLFTFFTVASAGQDCNESGWNKLISESGQLQLQGRNADAAALLESGLGKQSRLCFVSRSEARAALELGRLHNSIGEENEAERYLTLALRAYERLGLRATTDYVVALTDLSSIYDRNSQFARANRLQRQAGDLCVSAGMSGAAECKRATLFYGGSLLTQGKYSESEQALRAVLAETLTGTSGDRIIRVNALSGLAMVLYSTGRKPEAETSSHQTVELAESLFGASSSFVLIPLRVRGVILAGLRQFEEADAVFKRALHILESAVSHDKWSYAATLLDYSWCLRVAGRSREAKQVKHQAETILAGLRRDGLRGDTVDIHDLK